MNLEGAIERWLADPTRRPLGADADTVLRGMAPSRAVAFMTELFERSEFGFSDVTNEDAALVLRFLVDGNESNYGPRCIEPTLPISARERYVRSVRSLFSNTIAPRLAAGAARTMQEPDSALATLCLSWWTVCPLLSRAGPGVDEIDATMASALWDVLRDVTLLAGDECAVGATSGLLHYASVPGACSALVRVLRDLPRRSVELPAVAAQSLFSACVMAAAARPADVQ